VLEQISEQPVDTPPADILDSARAGGLVIRGAVFRLLGYVVGGALAAASAILLTRHLGVVRFGQYVTIVALATLLTQLAEGGLTSLATRDLAIAAPERRARIMSNRLGLQVASTVFAIALGIVFALAAGYGSGRIWGTAAATLGLGLAALQIAVAVPLVTSLRLGLTSALELARQAIFVALTVALVLLGAGLLPFLLALIPSSAAVLAVTWSLAHREVRLRPTFDWTAWVALVRPAVVLSLSSGLATIYVFTTQVLTSLAASATQTGLFAASLRVFGVVASIPGLMVAAALPLLARAARDDAHRLEFAIDRLYAVALVAGVGVGLLLVIGAKPIIDVIAGPRYGGAVVPLRIEGAAVLGSCLTPVWSNALLALHRHMAMLLCNLVSLAVTVGVTLSLAPQLGARGAALATVAGEWTVALSLLFALARARSTLIPRHLGLIVRVALAAGAGVAMVLLPISAPARLGAALVAYVAAIVMLRALPRELRELLPGRSR
jgi:O-antigen/teichoic acid export membrane protein